MSALVGWGWDGERAATPDELGVPDELDASTLVLERNLERGLAGAVAVREVGGEVLTYRKLRGLVVDIAPRLPWPRGSRVVVHLGHSVEFIVSVLALLRAGLVVVPVPSTANLGEALGIVEDSEPAAVLTHRARELAPAVSGTSCEVLEVRWDGPVEGRLARVLAREPRSDRDWPRSRADEAYWLYTSGTSGRPKAARHRHQDIACAAEMWATNVLALGSSDKCLSLSPMTHSFGLAAGLFFPLWAGAEAVVVRATHHRAVWESVREEGVTRLFGVPRHFVSLLEHVRPAAGGHRISTAYSSGELLPPELQRRFADAVGVPLLDAMGSSETFSNPISSTADAWRPGSSGRAIPGVAARLRSAGSVVQGPGTGILEISSPANAFEYWNRPGASGATFVDGYCITGDIFERDSDGFLHYKGRDSSRFKVFGEFVDPLALEVAARRVPGVADAVAFGAPGPNGVAVCAIALVLGPGSDGAVVADAVRAEVLRAAGNSVVPHTVFAVPAFPTTHSGKLHRAVVPGFVQSDGRVCP